MYIYIYIYKNIYIYTQTCIYICARWGAARAGGQMNKTA